jgi:hypothetical protein
MKTLRITLALFECLLLAVANAEESRMSVARNADEMIARFEQGKLRPGYDAGGVRADKSTSGMPIIIMGPLVMIEPTNVEESGGVVELNGEDLAVLGTGVFPYAFALLDHKCAYMRIIGVTALNSISGCKAVWFYSTSPWDTNGDQTDWALEAKKTWIEWYATRLTNELRWTKKKEQPGPAQPATQPAEKAPVKDQPSTPTSKVSPR